MTVQAEVALQEQACLPVHGRMIDFNGFKDIQSALPPAEDFPEERSKGCFSEMSGLADVSIGSLSESSDACSEACSDPVGDSLDDDEDAKGESSQSSVNAACSCDEETQKELDASHEGATELSSKSPKATSEGGNEAIITPRRKYARKNDEAALKVRLAK
ncbi:hypothetical protein CC86DRAFT_367116 [Ophiobolus disseminans]|uniref:Uncharacterized protein n=1 Tax=Ophiobolus disseminans TaxID=1469910 RepID=A0A6A7ACA3_9PLEO|nr:hypothetical protein CC86DRAFT_367116 [Ophiobolus disseminans]